MNAKALAVFLGLLVSASATDVVSLTSKDFHTSIKEGFWLVKFMAPWCGHCQSLKPVYDQAATALKGKLTLAAVDATAYDDLREEFGIQSFPTLKLFRNGEFRENYNGERTVAGLESYYEELKIMGEKPPSDVLVLTSKNFDQQVEEGISIVKFYAPWCGHCKALAPTWEEIATQLRPEGVMVGKVDATSESKLMKKFGVQGFPVIKLFKQGKLKGDHKGARTTEGIVAWMKQLSSAGTAELKRGQLAELFTTDSPPTFVLVGGTDDHKKMFEQAADEHMVEGKVAFSVADRTQLSPEEVVRLPRTANTNGDLYVVNSGEAHALETQINPVSVDKFVIEHKERYFWDDVVPGESFNEVMYSAKMAAVIHVGDQHEPATASFIQEFKEAARSLRGQFVFGKFDAAKNSKLSEQVGMFPQFLPGLVVFDSKKLKYYSDRSMGRTKDQIAAFLESVNKGLLLPKKPGDENEFQAEQPLGKLYDSMPSANPTEGRARLDSHDKLLQQLVKSQSQIQEAIAQIKEEMIGLRRDMETILK